MQGHRRPKRCEPQLPYSLNDLTFYVSKDKGREWAFAEANKHVPYGYTLIRIEDSDAHGGCLLVYMTRILG